MNTKIIYLYRDASNYKQWHEVILTGRLSPTEIVPFLFEGRRFIPSLLGLPDLQERFAEDGFAFPTEDDHPWHELHTVQETSEAPNSPVSTEQFLQRLKDCHHRGWEAVASHRRRE